ncbi:MAG TPA: DUF4331 family protein, partial [Ilumatobacteraceae bacterium]|nr:DUF4331 family protein [Ilumatobacteraceae bacterium]
RYVASARGVALLGAITAVQVGTLDVRASGHREPRLTAGDPRADTTDVYAFGSPDAPDTVPVISNCIPFEEPNGGPHFYTWAETTRYTIKIDNDGDALADLTYVWVFDTVIRDGDSQFLYNTGPVTSLDDPDLNIYQTYDLTLEVEGGATIPLLNDAISAPSHVGPASMPDYETLRDQAIYPLLAPGVGQAYAGQADDPFFLDLRVFDLLYGGDASEVGQDTLAGYNVNSVALQVPKAALAIAGDAANNPVVGIWSTTERFNGTDFVQVSRLGNPLINEVIIPLNLKDAFNSISPDVDATIPAVVEKVLDPILPKLIESIYGVPAPARDRNDLFEIFLQGISEANAGASGDPATVLPVDLNSQDLNAGAAAARGVGNDFQPSEMLRLNMAVPPTASPNNYGVIAGDIAGFPNGRRLADDVVDIAIQVVEGAAITGQLNPALATLDSVDRNDKDFGTTFPYLALPHSDSVNLGVDRSPRSPEYISVNPERILDTRNGTKPTAGSTTTLQVTGVGQTLVPGDAKTVYLNVTTDRTRGVNGFVTVYPCDAPLPTASNLNPIEGNPVTSLVAAKLSASGTVCLFTNIETDLIVDVQGYHPSTAQFVPTQPVRLLDTRSGSRVGYAGAKPVDGQNIPVRVTGMGDPAVAADAESVVLVVTAGDSSEDGFVTAYPCGESPGGSSTVNFGPGQVRANLVQAKVGADGSVCLNVAESSVEVIVDLAGWFPADSAFVPSAPERVLDTRPTSRVQYSGLKPIAGQTIELKVTGFGRTQIPSDAGTVALNLTSTDNTPGFATVYPCGSPRPNASNLNYDEPYVANAVMAKIGEGGRVCIWTDTETHLVVDISGYFMDTVLG